LTELGPLDGARLATASAQRRAPAGLAADVVAAEVDLEPLRELAAADEGTPTDPRAGGPRRGPLDRAWNVRVNIQVDPDL
jgi:predicted transcriptional regulator of viral defense system